MANDNHTSYRRIGFTVFVGAIAIVLSLIYLGGMRGRGSEVYAETYYDKPVSGLSVGSVVNFRGVKLGEVREISFVGSKYVGGEGDSRIYILMALDSRLFDADGVSDEEFGQGVAELVEKRGLRASVVSSGITGLSRIELNYVLHENLDPVQPISWKPQYAYIPSKISLFDNVSVAATKVLNQINRMDLASAWSNVTASLDSLARTMSAAQTMLETRQGDIDRMLDNLSATAESVKSMASELKHNPSLLIRDRQPVRLDETE